MLHAHIWNCTNDTLHKCSALSLMDENLHFIILSVWISSLVWGLSPGALFSYANSSITGQTKSPTLRQKPMSSNHDQTPVRAWKLSPLALATKCAVVSDWGASRTVKIASFIQPQASKTPSLNSLTWMKVFTKLLREQAKWKNIQICVLELHNPFQLYLLEIVSAHSWSML